MEVLTQNLHLFYLQVPLDWLKNTRLAKSSAQQIRSRVTTKRSLKLQVIYLYELQWYNVFQLPTHNLLDKLLSKVAAGVDRAKKKQ